MLGYSFKYFNSLHFKLILSKVSYPLIQFLKANQCIHIRKYIKILKDENEVTRPINSKTDTLKYKYFDILVQSSAHWTVRLW